MKAPEVENLHLYCADVLTLSLQEIKGLDVVYTTAVAGPEFYCRLMSLCLMGGIRKFIFFEDPHLKFLEDEILKNDGIKLFKLTGSERVEFSRSSESRTLVSIVIDNEWVAKILE